MNYSLIINKLIIEGESYKRTLPFCTGINIIEGEMYSGKSLVLKLIDYLLGKDNSIKGNVQKELRLYCEKAFIELTLSGQTITVERNLWKNTNKIFIYFCNIDNIINYSPRVMDINKYNRFLLEKLDIPIYKVMKHKQHSKERIIEHISFRDLNRYMYIDQHSLGTHTFMKYSDGIIKKKNNLIFDVLFDFIEFDDENILNEIKDLMNEIEVTKTQINGLESYIYEMDVKTKVELQNLYNDNVYEIEEYIKEKSNILNNVNSRDTKSKKLYSKTKLKIIEIEEKISNIDIKQNELRLELDSRNQLLHEYTRELKELNATSESYNLLSKSEHKHICPLCSGEVNFDFNLNINENSIIKLENELNYKIQMINNMITKILNKENDLEYEKVVLSEDLEILRKALEVYKNNIDTPYLSEIEAINLIIIKKNKSLNDINENIKIINKIEEKYLDILTKEKQLDKLNKKLNKLKISEEDKKSTIDSLSEIYRNILIDLKLTVNKASTYIDYNNYMPYYNGANILEHESGGILVCIQIAYLSAILEYKKINHWVKHPGMIMLDTIGKYLGTALKNSPEEFTEDMIMDPINHIELHKLLIKLGSSYQIILVENIPPEISKNYVQYRFYKNGFRGLVDLSKNEKIK